MLPFLCLCGHFSIAEHLRERIFKLLPALGTACHLLRGEERLVQACLQSGTIHLHADEYNLLAPIAELRFPYLADVLLRLFVLLLVRRSGGEPLGLRLDC
jgi:hypothetical protein